MGYRISTPINVMLFEAREVPLKFRYNFLTRKYLIRSFSRDLNPVIESLNSLRLSALRDALRTKLLISLPILPYFQTFHLPAALSQHNSSLSLSPLLFL